MPDYISKFLMLFHCAMSVHTEAVGKAYLFSQEKSGPRIKVKPNHREAQTTFFG